MSWAQPLIQLFLGASPPLRQRTAGEEVEPLLYLDVAKAFLLRLGCGDAAQPSVACQIMSAFLQPSSAGTQQRTQPLVRLKDFLYENIIKNLIWRSQALAVAKGWTWPSPAQSQSSLDVVTTSTQSEAALFAFACPTLKRSFISWSHAATPGLQKIPSPHPKPSTRSLGARRCKTIASSCIAHLRCCARLSSTSGGLGSWAAVVPAPQKDRVQVSHAGIGCYSNARDLAFVDHGAIWSDLCRPPNLQRVGNMSGFAWWTPAIYQH